MSTAGFTVVTPNYFAHGLSVKASFLLHNPDCQFYIGVIGRKEDLPIVDNTGIYFIDEIRDDRIPLMLQQYTAFEMSCAVKPFFASLLFDKIADLEHLVYLDGDILVFGRFLSPAPASITISPHRASTIGFLPEHHPLSDIALNRFGVFNAGYFEVRKTTEGLRFLEWWKQLMSEACYNKPDEHLFVDQLWLNAVPAFFPDLHINRHPGYNFAYWNLIERKLTGHEGQWLVNGEPLIFFHFSHYKFEDPERMTSFDSSFLSFTHFPELRQLYKAYELSVMQHGYDQFRALNYPYNTAEKKIKKGLLGKLFGG